MDGHDCSPLPHRALGRSSSFSSQRSSLLPPPPLSISVRPLLIPSWQPPSPTRDYSPSLVEDHVFLGSDRSARDLPTLRSLRISHVLSCVGGPHPFRPELRYKTLWLSDTASQDITSVFFDVFDLLERVRLHPLRHRVLVHCSRGVSRSAALVVAYVMWRHSLPFDVALRRVRAARPVTDPNLGFAVQLLSFQSRILGRPSSPRLYRMAPHSAYDPLHLVPKAVDHASAADFDPRGAFVLRSPRGKVFAWIGGRCDPVMARAAERAAAQVVRYEHAEGPVVTVEEGSEGADFWELLGVGECRFRRVEAYDLDFEIFVRAVKGGVVPAFAGDGKPVKVPAWEGGWGMTDDDGDEVEGSYLEPFGSPQSLFPRTPSTPSSVVSDLSPTSSLSDWCNMSTISDWATSSASPGSDLSAVGMEVDAEEEDVWMEPVLFRWPEFRRLEDLHTRVLDSHSVFVLLAPVPGLKRSWSRILYVWVGRKSPIAVDDNSSAEIARRFRDQMKYSVNIPFQVVREDEEPEHFLNHLFSFHQSKEASPK